MMDWALVVVAVAVAVADVATPVASRVSPGSPSLLISAFIDIGAIDNTGTYRPCLLSTAW